jgi:hypothetical protein
MKTKIKNFLGSHGYSNDMIYEEYARINDTSDNIGCVVKVYGSGEGEDLL